VWFAGAHADIGGSYKPDVDGCVLSNNFLVWMISQAEDAGLTIEEHLKDRLKPSPMAKIHHSRRNFYRVKKKYYRPIDHGCGDVIIHDSVTQRWDQDSKYRPQNLVEYF